MLRYVTKRRALDHALFFTLLTRVWQALAGLVSLVLITKYFSPEVQGFYYTFSSLLALQTFFELGLYLVIVSLVSREWSKLQVHGGIVVGDKDSLSRLASLLRFLYKWYFGASILFVFGVGVVGHVFLAQSDSNHVAWLEPWWCTVLLAGLLIWITPILSVLEGCNQVETLSKFRLLQTVAEAFTIWLLCIVGSELWVTVGFLTIKIVTTLSFLLVRYHSFLRSLWFGGEGGAMMDWKDDVWPMQWQLAAQGMVNFFANSLFTPVMFYYSGALVAGQMGMTLQVISVIQLMGLAWVQTKVPYFGILAARKEYPELDRVWRSASIRAVTFTMISSVILWLVVFVLGEMNFDLSTRMLSPLLVALFLIAYSLLQITNCQAIYLRAYGKEAFLFVGVGSGILIGASVYIFGKQFGPLGASASFVIVSAFFTLPLASITWMRRRKEWQELQ